VGSSRTPAESVGRSQLKISHDSDETMTLVSGFLLVGNRGSRAPFTIFGSGEARIEAPSWLASGANLFYSTAKEVPPG
jgi:hypothetical protein